MEVTWAPEPKVAAQTERKLTPTPDVALDRALRLAGALKPALEEDREKGSSMQLTFTSLSKNGKVLLPLKEYPPLTPTSESPPSSQSLSPSDSAVVGS